MTFFDDDYLQNLLRQQRYLEQQKNLLGHNVSVEMTKAMLEGWERQRRQILGPHVDLRDSQRQYLEMRDRLIPGSTTSYLGGMVDALVEAARTNLIANDVRREAGQWNVVRDSLRHAARRSEIDRLYQMSAFEWQVQLGRLTNALDDARRSHAGWVAPASLTQSFAAPAFAYSEFSRQTIAALPDAPDSDVPALETSLALADQQLSTGTALAVSLIESSSASSGPTDAESSDRASGGAAPPPPGHEAAESTVDAAAAGTNSTSLSLFRAQQSELVAAGATLDDDYDAIIQMSPSARATELARRLVVTLVEVDTARNLAGQPEIFSRTLASMGAICTLSWSHVYDERTLGSAVDALYFLVYEGSGTMNRIRPILADALCEPVWKLKHVRNYWLRHDPQHGQPSEQRKKFAALRAAFAYFGSPAKPRTPGEFAGLYEALLTRMVEFADALLAAVVTALGDHT